MCFSIEVETNLEKLSNQFNASINEKAFDHKNNCIIECNKKYFRPSEVDSLQGNPKKAINELNWRPIHSLDSLIDDMIIETKID